jgi:required for meiotic nuclear division protein 1
LPARARAIERKLVVIRETADTITDLISTRTSHRLEHYIIAPIAIEIALGIFYRILK